MAVYGADPPSMKEGLWSIHSQVVQHPSEQKTTDASVTLCRDAAYDKQVRDASMAKDKCKPTTDKSTGTAMTFETDCKIAGSAVKFTETVETTGDTASHTVTNSSIVQAIAGISGMTITADMTYISACPPGTKPGDANCPMAASPICQSRDAWCGRQFGHTDTSDRYLGMFPRIGNIERSPK